MTIDTDRAQIETRALRMLRSGDSIKDVSQATGLTTDEITKLQRDYPGPTPTPAPQPKAVACDYAGCRGLATSRAQGWAFCDTHAAAHAKLEAEEAEQAKVSPGAIARLLEDASGHTVAKVRNLATRIETQLDQLRALIAEHAEAEKARRREAEEKAKAKAEVERLERELAAAKARLKGKPTPVPAGGRACESCGEPVVRKATRGPLPKRCDACKAAA